MKVVTLAVPKSTAVASLKLVPVMVTVVPPLPPPVAGETAVTVGAAVKVKLSAEDVAEVPSALVTVTSTAAADSAGVVATIWLAVSLIIDAAAVLPKLTAVAPARSAPVIVTVVPPPRGPVAGDTLVTAGMNWNLSAADVADVPPAVMTVTSTSPVPAGATTTIWLAVSLTRVVTGRGAKVDRGGAG